MATAKKLAAGLKVGALWVLCLAICGPALGQDIGEMYVRSPVRFVFGLFRNYDVVADGELYAFPEYSEAELRSLEREDVVIRFRVDKLYKGSLAESFEVRLPNDMLEFPGESISRYEKRHQLKKQYAEERSSIQRQKQALMASSKAGEISAEEYRAQSEEIDRQLREIYELDNKLGGSVYVGTEHGKAFYDLGGGVRRDEKYLIACDIDPGGTGACLLDHHLSSGKLFWGERRAYVLPGFDNVILIPRGAASPGGRATPRAERADQESVVEGVEDWRWGIYRGEAAFDAACKRSAATGKARLEGSVDLKHETQITSLIRSPVGVCFDGKRSPADMDRTAAHEQKHAAAYAAFTDGFRSKLAAEHDDLIACNRDLARIKRQFAEGLAELRRTQAAHAEFCGEPRTVRQCVMREEDLEDFRGGGRPNLVADEAPAGSYACADTAGPAGAH